MNHTEFGEENVAYLKDDAFCKMLNQMMEEQDVSARILSHGLCSESMFSKIRQGKRVPDKMMRDRILGRLGLSDERCENLLDHEEYIRWALQFDIIKTVKRKEIAKARKLLKKYVESRDCAEKIEQQFICAMELQLRLYEGAPAEEIAKKLEFAVKLTVPRIDKCKIYDLLLDIQELNLVLEYEKYNHPGRFVERCEEMLLYIKNSTMEEWSRAKIHPKVSYYLCEQLIREGGEAYHKIIHVTSGAVSNLRNTQKNHYLWELLDFREAALEKLMEQFRSEGKEKRTIDLLSMYEETIEWKWAVEVACEMVEYPVRTNNFCYLYMQQEMYDINAVIRCRREMLGLSRAKLSAGDFNEKTLIRLETENRKPRTETIKKLFDRLNLSGELQRVDVVADNRRARDLVEWLVKYGNNFELEKEQETLQQLEKCLDMRIPLNRQFVKATQAMILHGGDIHNREEAFALMKEALECTVPLERVLHGDKKYLTGGEITCLYNMAIYSGNSTMSIYHETLLQMCRKYEEEGTVEAHISSYAWIMSLMAKIYSNMRCHEMAIDLSEKVIRSSLECGRLAFVEQNLDCISWNREQTQKKGTSKGARCDRKKDLEICIVLSRLVKEHYRERKYQEKLRTLEETD